MLSPIDALESMNDLLCTELDADDSILPEGAKIILIKPDQYPVNTSNCDEGRVLVLDHPLEKSILFNVLHACHSKHSTEDDVLHLADKLVSSRKTGPSLHVLVADDNATNRVVLQRMLEKLGHRYTIVTGGEAILTSLENQQYDAVIADKNMPDLGGLEAYQAYCFAHGGNPPVPFIILTADATEESRASCKAAGIDLFLTKPVSLAKLHETLSSLQITGEGISTHPEVETGQPDSDPESLPLLSEEEFGKLTSLTAGNNDFIIELINNFESDAMKDLHGLESAVARHDRTAFCDHAHALKGCALYLGLTRLAQLSKVAQFVDNDGFNKDGIAHVQAIARATNDSIQLLHDRIASLGKKVIPN